MKLFKYKAKNGFIVMKVTKWLKHENFDEFKHYFHTKFAQIIRSHISLAIIKCQNKLNKWQLSIIKKAIQ